MHATRRRIGILGTIAGPLAILALTTACGGSGHDDGVDVQAFRAMARAEVCADQRNELFLVDDTMVFWTHLTAACADSGGFDLFGSSPEQGLCSLTNTISGPLEHCEPSVDPALFDTMVAHSTEPDLGLGPSHVVEPIAL